MRKLIHTAALFAFMSVLPASALAGKADIVAASAKMETDGTFTFSVTVKSDDTGWDKYADRWEVADTDGTVLGTRVLAHPHENEQPFTRDLSGVAVPAGVAEVVIRAHDKVEGFGGKELTLRLVRN